MDSYEYPHLNQEQAQTLKEIKATPDQCRASDVSARNTINHSLQKYSYNGKSLVLLVTGATGAGKSATANTVLGRKVFKEGSSAVSVTTQVQEDNADVDGLRLTVVDTPFSWHTQLDYLNTPTIDVFILVINLASPRFGQAQLDELRSLTGPDGSPLLKSGRCVVVLSHADSALQQVSLREYLTEIEGDPLHTLLTKDLQGRIIAVNNAAFTQYERQANQRAILYLALQAKGGVPGGYGISNRYMIGTTAVLTVEILLGSMLFGWPPLPYPRNMCDAGVTGMTMAYAALLHTFLHTLLIENIKGRATSKGGAGRNCVTKRSIVGAMVTLTVTNLLGSMLVGWPFNCPYLRNKYVVGVTGMGLTSAALLAFLSKQRRPIPMACAIGTLSAGVRLLYMAMFIRDQASGNGPPGESQV